MYEGSNNHQSSFCRDRRLGGKLDSQRKRQPWRPYKFRQSGSRLPVQHQLLKQCFQLCARRPRQRLDHLQDLYRRPRKSIFLSSPRSLQLGQHISGATGFALSNSVQQVNAIALDGSGNIWLDTSGNLTELVGASAPLVTPTVTAVANNTIVTRP